MEKLNTVNEKFVVFLLILKSSIHLFLNHGIFLCDPNKKVFFHSKVFQAFDISAILPKKLLKKLASVKKNVN